LAHALITVESRGATWCIELNGKRFGAYRSEEAALWDAVAVAIKAKATGGDARVQIKDGTGTRPVWPKPGAGAAHESPVGRGAEQHRDEWAGLDPRRSFLIAEKDR
jgi:hypothetical protein